MKPVPPIRLGISSCLLGQKVRYDGNHKHARFITGTLGKYFEFVPVCPEIAIGLGVPRPPIRLIGTPVAPRAVGVADPARDVTRALTAYGVRMARSLDDLSGYIFKSRSPSCGVERVKVYGGRGRVGNGRGIYATAFLAQQPLLPVEEEGRLDNPEWRNNFIERVFAYRRWQALIGSGLTMPRLMEFHRIHRLALLTHGERSYREMEKFIARAGRYNARRASADYLGLFMAALKYRATRTRHADVLQRAAGYLKKHLTAAENVEMNGHIDAYRGGQTPLAVPIIRLRRYAHRHIDLRLSTQTYLYPDPREFSLRYQI